MKASFLAKLVFEVLMLIVEHVVGVFRKQQQQEADGEKSEKAAEEAVSRVEERKDEKQKYPTIEQAKEYLKHRRNRRRP